MADGFKIANAFVEVQVDLDRRQVHRASTEAGHESGKGFGDGFGKETRRRRGGLVGAVTGGLSSLVSSAAKIGTKVGSSLTKAATSATEGLVSSLPKALSNPYTLTAVVAAATTLGVVAGAALNGAILAALGTGVIAAGIALAAQDPKVEKAAAGLGEFMLSGLQASAMSFIPVVTDAIGYIKAEFRAMLPDINGIFREASSYVAPLTEGVTGFIRNILPGIRAAVANMGPIFDALRTGLPELGRTVGYAFEYMSEHAESAGSAVTAVLEGIEFAVNVVTATITTLTMAWEALTFVLTFGHILDEGDKVTKTFHRMGEATTDLTKDTHEVVDATKTFIAVLDRLNQTAINAIDTEGAYQRAIDDVARAKKEENAVLVMQNGVLVQNTEKQRAGAAAINEVAKAALAKAAAAHEAALKTGTMAQADAAARASIIKSRAEFIKLAEKLGLSAKQAKELADQLLGIPKNVTTTVTTKYIKVDGGYQLPGDDGPRGHADGGLIRGPGTGTSDSIVRRVSDGEYVIKAAAVKRIGTKTLDAMNATGRTPMATGSTAVMDRPATGPDRPPVIINLDGAAFYGVGSADQFVADMYDALDRYGKRYR